MIVGQNVWRIVARDPDGTRRAGSEIYDDQDMAAQAAVVARETGAFAKVWVAHGFVKWDETDG